MKHVQSLVNTTWDSKYDLVWIPKCRKDILYGHLRKHLGDVFKELALQKESEVIEGRLMKDYIHIIMSILPKYAVSQGGQYQGEERDSYPENIQWSEPESHRP